MVVWRFGIRTVGMRLGSHLVVAYDCALNPSLSFYRIPRRYGYGRKHTAKLPCSRMYVCFRYFVDVMTVHIWFLYIPFVQAYSQHIKVPSRKARHIARFVRGYMGGTRFVVLVLTCRTPHPA
jgi:hypothetical protein